MRLCLLHVIEQEKSYKMLIALFTTNYMFSISKKSFPVYIVTYNIKWVNNAWTYSTCYYSWPNLHNFLPPARLCFFNFLAVSGDGGGGSQAFHADSIIRENVFQMLHFGGK